LTAIVLDASAGVELALQTPIGRQIQAKLPEGATTWAPEHYYAEAVAVLRRLELNRKYDPARIQIAFDRLLNAPIKRVLVKPLVSEAWALRHNYTLGDALYVIVARHLAAPLVTADLKLAQAPNLGIETITPNE
jgi:predicted nucleic acid-binding protein